MVLRAPPSMEQQVQVPRGTSVSQSVIFSSNINQGDPVGTASSSSSVNAATSCLGSTDVHTSPTSPPPIPLPPFTFIPSLYPNTNVYASISDMQHCSSNVKTCSTSSSYGVSADSIATITTNAGITKSSVKTGCAEGNLQDCPLYDNANLDAIRGKGDAAGALTHLPDCDCDDDGTMSRYSKLEPSNKRTISRSPGHPTPVSPVSWLQYLDGPASNRRWGIPKGMGLRGGGENSLNTGTSGWGTPPAAAGAGWGGAAPAQWGANRPPGPTANPNQPNPPGQDFNNQNKPGAAPPPGVAGPSAAAPGGAVAGAVGGAPIAQPAAGGPAATSWAQAAGKGLPQGPTPAQNSTTKQIEQLNSMREALFAQDGWGGQHVNQDTSWDTPGSPEPVKGDTTTPGAPLWKQNVNNGTDLWEANLRNGGQPPVQPQNKTPWGHTPTTNIGGTWGEEDEPNDPSSNVWTGGAQMGQGGGPGAPVAQPPWPGAPTGPWPDKKPEWGAGPGAPAPTPAGQWGGNAGSGPAGPMGDPRGPPDPNSRDNMGMPMSDMMRMRNDGGVMRGDPRGVSGRLNNTEQMWAAHQPPPTPKLPGLPPGGSQWSGGLPKDLSGMVVNPGGKPSGWEEPSPPAQRRNIPNYDDGTSLWGQQQPQTRLPQPAQGMNVAPNKNIAQPWDKLGGNNMGRGNMGPMGGMPGGMPSVRMPSAGAIKPDMAPVWGQGGRNGAGGAWDHDNSGGWGDDSSKLQGNWPGESPLTPPSWPGGKPVGKPGGWGEDVSDGGGAWPPQQMQRPKMPNLSSDFIYSSKPFRYLCDLNYKKEDVETALRTTNMNQHEAMELLATWGRREEHPFDQAMLRGAGYNPVQPLGYGGGPGSNGANGTTLNLGKMNMMGQGGQMGGQGPGQGQAGAGMVGGQPRPGNTPQPSAQQLKLLIQQIQMAVQTGYLNHQILNQPLAPPTLLLVNQLLQQIKILQQLNQRHQLLGMSGQIKNNPAVAASISLQVAKVKQNIQNYQNQITGHQANYMKQQQQQPPLVQPPLVQPGDPSGDLFKSPFSDPLSALPNFPDLSISDKTSMSSFQTQAQSRLNQWKLPSSHHDDKEQDGNEFSRAPGSAKGNHTSHLNETWSVGGRSDGGWPDTTSGDLSDKDSQWSSQQANSIADYIPEFEPGKPWKGTQMKTVEEDPSMTPGSVARSPLTMGSLKDSDILSDSNKASPGPHVPNSGADNSVLTSLGLSSSPWTLNSGTSSVYTSPLSKLTSSKSWGESAGVGGGQGSELWMAPGKSAARGPPPGLGSKLGQPQPNWAAGAGSRSSWGTSPSSWASPWLILRNLTPQIDGSTLKTLCMQHGPLHNFHLHLNVGTALAKYSSREEANKAQQALNNCVLGNTTIFAESPGESEVATLLNQLGHSNSQNQNQQQQQQQQQSNWNIRTSQPASSKTNDTWATSAGSLPGYAGSGNLWQSTGSSSSLWGSDTDAHRTTPSGTSLNSFLPPDLLNGETM